MKGVSTGFGLCVLSAAIALHSVIDRLAPEAGIARADSQGAMAVATRGPEPTIVWYGVAAFSSDPGGGSSSAKHVVYRAWSDGTLEAGLVLSQVSPCNAYGCGSQYLVEWFTVSTADQGRAALADLNRDQQVNGADLGLLLARWGDAPHADIPSSDCPLNLVNP